MAVTRVGLFPIAMLVASGLLASACGSTTPAPAETPQLEALSVTRWTAATELFAEYPPLVRGETSRFAIHLTRLDTSKPLLDGRVEVRLEGGGPVEVFATDAPSRPGIFGVDVRPTRAGTRTLVIELKARGLIDVHRIDGVTVHPTVDAAKAVPAEPEGAPGISFLKEQQWSLDFGTAVVTTGTVRDSLRVPARITARPGGAADVLAPIDGRLVSADDAPLGAAVTEGQVLARLLPPASEPGRSAAAAACPRRGGIGAGSGHAGSGASGAPDPGWCRTGQAVGRGSSRRGAVQGPTRGRRGQPGSVRRGAYRCVCGHRRGVRRAIAADRGDRAPRRGDRRERRCRHRAVQGRRRWSAACRRRGARGRRGASPARLTPARSTCQASPRVFPSAGRCP